MSVGNLKDYGNKGNNFPYQKAVLILLDQIANAAASDCCPTAATEATLTTRNAEATQLLIKALLTTIDGHLDVALSTRASETTLTTAKNNVTSKMNRIKGAANYSRAFTYFGSTVNVQTVTHTGTTALGAETIVETFAYVNSTIDGSNITSIVYS
jgi:hypothetical protein